MILILALLFYEIDLSSATLITLDIKEDLSVGDSIKDLSSWGCTSYKKTVTSDQDFDCCDISSDHDQLIVAVDLDREESDYYSGTIDCIVDYSPFKIPYNLEVIIVDVNDNSPVFSEPSQTITVDETSNVPSLDYVLDGATDRDTKEFSVSNYKLLTGTDKFQLKTGVWSKGKLPLYIVIVQALDYDEGDVRCDLEIEGCDVDNNCATMDLVVNVNDVNDNRPVFEEPSYTGSIAEDATTQTVVLETIATDKDSGSNGKVVYSVADNTLPFDIRSDTGQIIVTRALDREIRASYTFQVTARDEGSPNSLTNSVTVVITVEDVNDNGPVIIKPEQNQKVSLTENKAVGSLVCQVKITDSDAGDNSKITVSLSGTHSARFRYELLDGDIGQIVTTQVLDREDVLLYTLIIEASDNGSPVRSDDRQFYLEILDENDNPPTIDNCGEPINVDENVNGEIFTVSASDRDTGDNAVITYTVQDTTRYTVSGTGAITLNTPFDYEATERSTVTVTVSNTGPGLSNTCTFQLEVGDVNDNAPVFQPQDPVTVREDVSVGTTIVTLEATDTDKIDVGKLRYYLAGLTEVFTVDPEGGEVTNKVLLDRETQEEYTLSCLVYDSDNAHQDTMEIQVTLEDVSDTRPQFINTPYSASVSDSVPVDEVILQVAAQDGDLGDTLQYSITSSFFDIEPNTGELSVSVTLATITNSPITSTVTVTDGKYTDTTDVSVTVYKDDGVAPLITTKKGSKLLESAPPGSTAGQCSASSTSPVTYSLTWDTEEGEEQASHFSIGHESGVIETVLTLNYEDVFSDQSAVQSYKLRCTARNIHGHTTSAPISIPIEGVNEYPPVFLSSVFQFNTVAVIDGDTVIGKVEATDEDSGTDGELQFSLETAKPGWQITSATGEILQLKQKTQKRDTEGVLRTGSVQTKSGSFDIVRLRVVVKDSPRTGLPRSSTANVTINVYAYEESESNNMVTLIGGAAGGGLVFILLLICVILVVLRRRKASKGSKDLTFVNPTSVKDKDGRAITVDGGYHSSEYVTKDNITLSDMTEYGNDKKISYNDTELGYDNGSHKYHNGSHHPYSTPAAYLNLRDKTSPHKMSVSTVLSDMKNDVQISAVPHRLTGGSMTHSASYESVHVFGSEGGGEGDAVIDAHTLFNKLSEIDDDMSVVNKSAHFLGDQDSAFSSLGSTNGEVTTPYHTEYLQDWKPAFQSVGKVCEGMLRNKQFAYGTRSETDSQQSVQPAVTHNNDLGSVISGQSSKHSKSHHTGSSRVNSRDDVVERAAASLAESGHSL